MEEIPKAESKKQFTKKRKYTKGPAWYDNQKRLRNELKEKADV